MRPIEIPDTVRERIDKLGGTRRLSEAIPKRERLRPLTNMMQSLSDPVRLSILYSLSAAPLCVCVMKSVFRIADSKLSYHLSNLRAAGLITQSHEGKFIVYEMTDVGSRLLSAINNIEPVSSKPT